MRFLRYSFLLTVAVCVSVMANYSISHAANLNCPQAMYINVSVDECQALVDLYDSTDGQNWFVNTNRDTDTDVCTWYGITCMNIWNQDRVIWIDLSSNNLVGTLPAVLSDLTELQRFILDFNDLWGTLSSDRSAWTHIHTFSLKGMNNNSNLPLVGWSLPSSWSARWNTIKDFTITDNRINGPLPTAWSNWSVIEEFNVWGNQLNWQLPVQFSSRWPTIKKFSVNNNQFVWPLPTAWSNWSVIEDFNISFNPLNAQLPSAWWTWWGTIKEFMATNSQLQGTLPLSWNAWWSSIKYFGVNINNLMGTLPSSWSSWGGKIETFSVLQNQLTWPLPRQRTTWWSSIKYFRAHNNQIGWSLPSVWGSRSNIKELTLSHNNLVGYLPSSWNSFSAIEIFTINDNRLIGPVPSSWGNNRPNIPAFGTYALLMNNCLQTNGYSVPMQFWLNNNVNLLPQNIPSFCNFTVNYATTLWWSISGAVVQSIPYGWTGTVVTAVPAPWCIFTQWSNGSTINPRIETNVTGNMIITGSFLCNTIPLNSSGVAVASISYWLGKVNQHFDPATMSRQTDPTGVRWAWPHTQSNNEWRGDRPLDYCRTFRPATVAVVPLNHLVTIHTWRRRGNIVPRYTGTKKAYQCVQSLSANNNPLPNRYSAPATTTVPMSRVDVPMINTFSVSEISPLNTNTSVTSSVSRDVVPASSSTITSPITDSSNHNIISTVDIPTSRVDIVSPDIMTKGISSDTDAQAPDTKDVIPVSDAIAPIQSTESTAQEMSPSVVSEEKR